MGEKLKPKFSSTYDLVPEGLHLFRVKKADSEKSDKSVKLFKVESKVEGGEFDGQTIFDNFPLVSKKNFGLERLCGFLIKLKVFAPKEEFDSDVFATEDFATKFRMGLNDRLFGGRVKHTKGEKGEMSNIVDYYTSEELPTVIAEEAKKGQSKGTAGTTAPEAGKAGTSPPATDWNV